MAVHTHEFLVTVGGSPLPAEVDALLESISVDQHVGLPAACTVRFHDPAAVATEKGRLRLGEKWGVSVKAGSVTTPLFAGEITGLEIQRSETGSTMTTVRAADGLHRLQRGRMTKTYQNMTYADVVRQVFQRNGLQVDAVESAGGVHPHISQVDESDWQFTRRLADDVGYVLAARDGKVSLRKPAAPGTDVVVASPRENVLRIDVSVSDDEQVRDVQVRGWDPSAKREVVSSAQPTAATVPSGVKRKAPAKAGTNSFVRTSHRYATVDHAKAAATAIAAHVADAAGEVNALLRGDARLHPGGTLEIADLGDPYNGRYTITQARHEYRPDEGYEVDVVAGSRRNRTLLGTVNGAGGKGRSGGVWPGIVTSVKDPDDLGRVRVKFPWLDSSYESFWARVVHPGAGANGRGIVWMPEVNDEVLVAFADGEVERPYVLGGVYNSKDKFDGGQRFDGTGKVSRRSMSSRSGHLIDFVDAQGKEVVRVKSGDGKFEIVYDASAQQLSITCKAAAGVKLDTSGPLTLQGQQVKINSKSTMDLNANGPMTVKGAVIRLN